MYFVILGNNGTSRCVRFTGKKPLWSNGFSRKFINQYDFDDESIWTNSKLEQELLYLDRKGKYSDSAAKDAINAEVSRRQGEDIQTYDVWSELMACISGFYDEHGFDDEYVERAEKTESCEGLELRDELEGIERINRYKRLRMYHKDDFIPEALELIKKLADSYRDVLRLASEAKHLKPGKDIEKDMDLNLRMEMALKREKVASFNFLNAFRGIFRSKSTKNLLVEAGRFLAQVYATEIDQHEYRKTTINEDFLYASQALLHEADDFYMIFE